METQELTKTERKNIIDSAHAWAWFHNYTVKCKSFPAGDDKFYVRVTLVKKHRNRDYA